MTCSVGKDESCPWFNQINLDNDDDFEETARIYRETKSEVWLLEVNEIPFNAPCIFSASSELSSAQLVGNHLATNNTAMNQPFACPLPAYQRIAATMPLDIIWKGPKQQSNKRHSCFVLLQYVQYPLPDDR